MVNYEPSPTIKNIPAAYYEQLTQHNDVVSVITSHPSTANQMFAKLRSYGNWLLAKQQTVDQGDIHFSIYVFSLDGKTP